MTPCTTLTRRVKLGAEEYAFTLTRGDCANQLEGPDGRLVNLGRMNREQRRSKAQLLLSAPGFKVHRHLVNGDLLLVNRQPTLHKPGIMAHKARVLEHVPEQTLRMNYPNCNAYNADFDGDEINCHFVQNQLARAEASYICNTDNQYIVPTSGNPLRGLIQDHVASAVKLTCKNTFLTRAQFQQLLYVGVCGLPGTEVVTHLEAMETPRPAVLRPRELWTGKQVISALLSHLCRPPLPPLNLDGKARTPPTAMGAEQSEHIVVFRSGELLSGVMDKNAIGNATLGVVHAVYELYGADLAGQLLSAFGRLFTFHLQNAGQTCGVQDLVLTSSADEERRRLLTKVVKDADDGLLAFVNDLDASGVPPAGAKDACVSEEQKRRCSRVVAHNMSTDQRAAAKVKLDGVMQGVINKSASDVIKACLPGGLQSPFLRNNFSMMVLTGAKGSAVNQSQISCFLGQQALEGQRVPIMVSGKSLPSFRAYDASARSMGFVQDRFLTGVKPQEYYFHCMAGREGLVDTAVKTSRSGYLQRCLVKHLEELTVSYDMSVRDAGGNLVQFLYGEDGLDPMSSCLMGGSAEQLLFLARNNAALAHKYALHEGFMDQGLGIQGAVAHRDLVRNVALDVSELKVGDFVQARRKRLPEVEWSRQNLLRKWWTAEIVKVRGDKKGKGQSGDRSYDLRYSVDGVVDKRVPLAMAVPPRASMGGAPEGVICRTLLNPLIKPGRYDPAMSLLNLGSDLGACSEKMQSAVEAYVRTNPDGIVSEKPSSTTVAADALEFLVWVKYMRSLACPGEAVGCVAAQSVGEPSTQMTLNTFHLAGHGGANVTLGIPRLREIIMTASKTKTPTMLLPLRKGCSLASAKATARLLSRLPLKSLLSHTGGASVGESIVQDSSGWRRQYRIRFHFESPARIKEVFAVGFSELADTVLVEVQKRMVALIGRERRRMGDTSKVNFVSQGGDKVGRGRITESGEEVDELEGGPKSGDAVDSLLDGPKDDDEEAGDSDEEGDEANAEYDDNEEDVSAPADSGSDSEYEDKAVEAKAVEKQPTPVEKKKAKAPREAAALGSSKQNKKEGWVEFSLSYPATSRRLLMVQLADEAAAQVAVRSVKFITNAYSLESDVNGETRACVQTEGVNFEAAWGLSEKLIDSSEIKCNDIFSILHTYGVEAARRSIVSEITGVFGVYGINVNPRHLSLIADHMTRSGGYVPMNRMGMNECSSPLLQMSFETTCNFLTRAAQEGLADNMESPSARIVLGKVPKLGTGAFELLVPIEN